MKFDKLKPNLQELNLNGVKKAASRVYCTPKVGHFWGVFYEI